ncbi:MAG: Crp/Fnr family transcriptional regulator [Paracoccus sp. (in: a-proteobacteria)]|uniref:transcriptional regulator FnrL n=1 Tax=Paracoccus sp. TaxID=267 RepID=UPI0026DF9C13|nr:Crp/Fnr family transcriptional regulator [Paracoccus sp. (in: a-proteobacteria)]MDO5621395.1 Crp/Fnr family transcriptional regulator [Paracoccus sp. (in: a-proteobacteria)]
MTQINPYEGQQHAVRIGAEPCADCPVRFRAVCSGCGKDDLDRLEAAKFTRSFQAGQVIVWAGDRLDFVASILSGAASMTQTLEDGRTQIVGLLLPSDFLGRPGRDRTPYTVTAVSDITLCCFRRRPFESLLSGTPALGGRLLQMTLDELDAAREWMLILGRKSAREKIASFLAILARREAARRRTTRLDGIEIDLPLTREAMADYLGLTLETVSRQMSGLKRDGLITLTGLRHVIIPDYGLLVAEGGDDADGGPLS